MGELLIGVIKAAQKEFRTHRSQLLINRGEIKYLR